MCGQPVPETGNGPHYASRPSTPLDLSHKLLARVDTVSVISSSHLISTGHTKTGFVTRFNCLFRLVDFIFSLK